MTPESECLGKSLGESLGKSLGESLGESLRESLGKSLPQALLTYTLAARTGHSDVPGKTTHIIAGGYTPQYSCVMKTAAKPKYTSGKT